MSRKEIKSQGKDVATAIIKGLNELGRRRDQVEVTVEQEAKPGFLGIGGRPAIVQIIEKKWDSEHSTPMKPREPRKEAPVFKTNNKTDRKRKDFKKAPNNRRNRVEKFITPKLPKENEVQRMPSAEIQNVIVPENMQQPMVEAKETLSKMLAFMDVKPENLNVWWDGQQERVLITFDCDHPAVVIGKEGKTLESIQYIITLVISRHFDKPVSVIADTQNYWRKLEDKINAEVERAVSMVKRTKKDYRFRPMSAQIRRYVHRFVGDNEFVNTISEGEGKWRKVVLKHSGKATTAQVSSNIEADAADDNAAQPMDKLTQDNAAAQTEQTSCNSGCSQCTCNQQAQQPVMEEACGAEGDIKAPCQTHTDVLSEPIKEQAPVVVEAVAPEAAAPEAAAPVVESVPAPIQAPIESAPEAAQEVAPEAAQEVKMDCACANCDCQPDLPIETHCGCNAIVPEDNQNKAA